MNTEKHSESQLEDCPDCSGDGFCSCEEVEDDGAWEFAPFGPF